MKYGLYLPNFGAFGNARTLADLGRTAEAAGWDGFFIWDHVAGHPLPMVDPWVGLSAVAVATERIRLGTTVTPLPRRRPWKIARETVSLDHLSDGRLTLGVGIGLGEAEWHDLGEEPEQKKRGAMLDEALTVLSGLWQAEPFSHDGDFYTVQNAHFRPPPVQQPRIPIWVGGFWPNRAPLRRAAHWDGIFPLIMADTPEEEIAAFRELVHFVQEARQELNRADHSFDFVAGGVTSGADREQAAAQVAPYAAAGATWWLEHIAPYRVGADLEAEPWPLAALQERVQQGPPAG